MLWRTSEANGTVFRMCSFSMLIFFSDLLVGFWAEAAPFLLREQKQMIETGKVLGSPRLSWSMWEAV